MVAVGALSGGSRACCGGVSYRRPWGEVQLQEPFSLDSVICQPAWVLSWWCLVHKAPRFARFVCPPSSQAMAWSIWHPVARRVQPGNRQVRSRVVMNSRRRVGIG